MNLTKRQKLEDLILNSSPKIIPDKYSVNLKILINRLLDKNPENRPSSDELCDLLNDEHRSSSSLGGHLFSATNLGILIATNPKPKIVKRSNVNNLSPTPNFSKNKSKI